MWWSHSRKTNFFCLKNASLQAKFNEDITVEKVKQTLGGLNYTEVNGNVFFKKKKKKTLGRLRYSCFIKQTMSSYTCHRFIIIKYSFVSDTQATAPYDYLMYMRCLALQLSAINSVSTGDVVINFYFFCGDQLLLYLLSLIIPHISRNRRWCTFFRPMYFLA